MRKSYRLGETAEESKSIAKQRLKNILISDRVNVSEEVLEMIRSDVIGVVKDYFSVEEAGSEVYLTTSAENKETNTSLIAVVPIRKAKKL